MTHLSAEHTINQISLTTDIMTMLKQTYPGINIEQHQFNVISHCAAAMAMSLNPQAPDNAPPGGTRPKHPKPETT